MTEVGALSLRIGADGGKATLAELTAIDTAAKHSSASAVDGATRSGAAQKAFSKEVAESTRQFQLLARTVDVHSRTEVEEVRQIASAQQSWLQQMRASTAEQQRMAAAVQQFERRVESASKTTGLFGSGGVKAMNGLAFGISQLAATGEINFRSLAQSIGSVTAFFGQAGVIASLVISTGLVLTDFWTRQRQKATQTAEVLAKLEKDAAARRTRERPEDVASEQEAIARGELRRIQEQLQALRAQEAPERQRRASDAKGLLTTEQQRVRVQEQIAALAAREQEAIAQVFDARVAARQKEQDALIVVQQLNAQDAEDFRRSVASQQTRLADLNAIAQLTGNHADQLRVVMELEREINALVVSGLLTLSQRRQLLDAIAASERQRQAALGTAPKARSSIEEQVPPGLGPPPPPPTRITIRPQDQALLRSAVTGLSAEALQLQEDMTRQFQDVGRSVTGALARGLSEGFSGGGLRGITASIASDLGSMAIEVGLKSQAIAAAMGAVGKALLVALANPFVAIAAGIALVALGRSIGGRNTGGGVAFAGGGGGFGGGGSATDFAFERLIVDPNSRRVQRPTAFGASLVDAPPVQEIHVIGADTIKGKRLLGENSQRFAAKGGRS